MYLSHDFEKLSAGQRRQFPRYGLQCRANIRIGTRHYAGFLHNISQKGAKLRTLTSIGEPGVVVLRLPDLRPLRCELRWIDRHHAGVAFNHPLTKLELRAFVKGRLAVAELNQGPEVGYAEPTEGVPDCYLDAPRSPSGLATAPPAFPS